MPSRGAGRILHVIAHNIGLARQFIDGMTFEAFASDERTVYAVTRCLEIISEASRRVPADLEARHADVPWERIAGARNVYRHDYEGVLASILWTTVRQHLGELERAVLAEGPSG